MFAQQNSKICEERYDFTDILIKFGIEYFDTKTKIPSGRSIIQMH